MSRVAAIMARTITGLPQVHPAFYLHEAPGGFTVDDGASTSTSTSTSVDVGGFSTDELRLSAGGTLSYLLLAGEDLIVVPYFGVQLGLSMTEAASSGFATLGTGFSLTGTGSWSLTMGAEADIEADGLRSISGKVGLSGGF